MSAKKRKARQETAPDTSRVIKASHAHLSEFYEGYVLLGIIAGSRDPVMVFDKGDSATQLALQAHVVNYVTGRYDAQE